MFVTLFPDSIQRVVRIDNLRLGRMFGQEHTFQAAVGVVAIANRVRRRVRGSGQVSLRTEAVLHGAPGAVVHGLDAVPVPGQVQGSARIVADRGHVLATVGQTHGVAVGIAPTRQFTVRVELVQDPGRAAYLDAVVRIPGQLRRLATRRVIGIVGQSDERQSAIGESDIHGIVDRLIQDPAADEGRDKEPLLGGRAVEQVHGRVESGDHRSSVDGAGIARGEECAAAHRGAQVPVMRPPQPQRSVCQEIERIVGAQELQRQRRGLASHPEIGAAVQEGAGDQTDRLPRDPRPFLRFPQLFEILGSDRLIVVGYGPLVRVTAEEQTAADQVLDCRI